MTRPTLAQHLRYRFDNLMARGTGAQIAMLALATLALVVATALVLALSGLGPAEDGEAVTFGHLMWHGLMHTIDAGTVTGDEGGWPYLFLMFFATLGGIFVLSALIGILTGGFGQLIASLRKGRSRVIEHDHTVILGYTSKISSLLLELSEANANRPSASVVILAARDKVEMDDAVRDTLRNRKLRVVTRTGNPLAVQDLELVALDKARSIIVLSPEEDSTGVHFDAHEADAATLKVLLAISKSIGEVATRPHVVCEIQDGRTLSVARMVAGDTAALLHTPLMISRLLVQTGRQSGLSAVYSELLSFAGNEIYIHPEPGLVGCSFREALLRYEDSCLIGVSTAEGRALIPPPFDRPFRAGDRVIAVSLDDDTVILNGRPSRLDPAALNDRPAAPSLGEADRTLILGDSVRLAWVLRELDAYAAPGSMALVVGENAAIVEAIISQESYANLTVSHRQGDVTDRVLLEALDVPSFDHVLVLAESARRSPEMADARSMITLLHLRDLLTRAGARVAITTEMLETESRDLASTGEVNDFIVSNALVSLVVSQVSENQRLSVVFDELLSSEGYEIYLKPVTDYVKPGVELDFYTVVEAAARRGHVAFGYRSATAAFDPAAGFGVRINPPKSESIRFGPGDKLVVLAER